MTLQRSDLMLAEEMRCLFLKMNSLYPVTSSPSFFFFLVSFQKIDFLGLKKKNLASHCRLWPQCWTWVTRRDFPCWDCFLWRIFRSLKCFFSLLNPSNHSVTRQHYLGSPRSKWTTQFFLFWTKQPSYRFHTNFDLVAQMIRNVLKWHLHY